MKKSKKISPLKLAMKASFEGILNGLPDATYRLAPGLSQSMLKPLAISPAHFQEALKQPAKATAAILFGRIAHHILLTPKVPGFWAVKPEDLDMRSPSGKAWVSLDVFGDVMNTVNAVMNHPVAKVALATAKREVSWFHMHRLGKDKVRLKGRIDLVPDGAALCDFKFVEDARETAFRSQCLDLKWYLQAPFYLDGYNLTRKSGVPKTTFIFSWRKNPRRLP